jgi:hypothetical protein
MSILDGFFGSKRGDLARLKELYGLFGETLHQLCRIGAALDKDPGIFI